MFFINKLVEDGVDVGLDLRFSNCGCDLLVGCDINLVGCNSLKKVSEYLPGSDDKHCMVKLLY